jgi:hypothetical protein
MNISFTLGKAIVGGYLFLVPAYSSTGSVKSLRTCIAGREALSDDETVPGCQVATGQS